MKKGTWNKRKIRCIETGKEFESLADAAKYYNAKPCNISHVLNGLHKTCRGLRFEYVEGKRRTYTKSSHILKQIANLQAQYAQLKAKEDAEQAYRQQFAKVERLYKELSKEEEVLAQCKAKWHALIK